MIIDSMDSLIQELDKLPPDELYHNILRSVKLDAQDIEELTYWNSRHYTRNCIASSDQYELLLVCWEKGQQSPIHDYAAREAWVQTIAGMLEEQRFIKKANGLMLQQSSILRSDKYSYMDSSCIHRYRNAFDGRTVSLHLYSRPIDFWNVYQERTLKAIKVKVNYDTFLGKKIFV